MKTTVLRVQQVLRFQHIAAGAVTHREQADVFACDLRQQLIHAYICEMHSFQCSGERCPIETLRESRTDSTRKDFRRVDFA